MTDQQSEALLLEPGETFVAVLSDKARPHERANGDTRARFLLTDQRLFCAGRCFFRRGRRMVCKPCAQTLPLAAVLRAETVSFRPAWLRGAAFLAWGFCAAFLLAGLRFGLPFVLAGLACALCELVLWARYRRSCRTLLVLTLSGGGTVGLDVSRIPPEEVDFFRENLLLGAQCATKN